jgi:hypothetical protein
MIGVMLKAEEAMQMIRRASPQREPTGVMGK